LVEAEIPELALHLLHVVVSRLPVAVATHQQGLIELWATLGPRDQPIA
jgi:hypothetical protein